MTSSLSGIAKAKLVALVICVAYAISCIVLIRLSPTPEIASYEFAKHYRKASIELGTVERPGIPFRLLFANFVKSPFAFEMDLGSPSQKGLRSVWIYSNQASNHGRITVEHEDKIVGTINNQLSRVLSAPVPKLTYVGDLDVPTGNLALKITGSNDSLPQHYAELGLLVLTPIGMSEAAVLHALSADNVTGAPDFGLVLLALTFAYAALFVVRPSGHIGARDRSFAYVLTAGVLAITVIFSLLYAREISSAPLSPQHTSQRAGIERLIDSGFKILAHEIDTNISSMLPDRQIIDDVPTRLQNVSGSFETTVYRTDEIQKFEKVSSSIFGGKLAELQLVPANKFLKGAYLFLVLIGAAILLDHVRRTHLTLTAALLTISVASIIASIRLSQGWDEFFINLRHAYMLLHYGVYSINANTMIEGTVDLLPLLFTALMGKIGINLVSAFIITSLAGNATVVVFTFLITNTLTKDRTWALIASLVVGLYPNVLWVGASGFSAVFFVGWMLAAAYFLLFTKLRLAGLLLLSTLTLLRTEGVIFACLMLVYTTIFKPAPNFLPTASWRTRVVRTLIDASIVIAPFICSAAIRYAVFQHAIPNPISFKNSHFDRGFFSAGVGRFSEMISIHDIHLMALAITLLLAANFVIWRMNGRSPEALSKIKNLLGLGLIILIFILPYYAGGGDWFPKYWNRYGLPFNITAMIVFFTLFYWAFDIYAKSWLKYSALLVFSFVLVFGYQKAAQNRRENSVYNNTISELTNPSSGRWQRVDNFSSLGQFLRDNLPADAVVSSPEEATIMYFSEKEMIGLLGVSNPQITTMPFQPYEPGRIDHRRRAHATIYIFRPDVIALFDPVMTGDFFATDNLNEKIHSSLIAGLFNQSMVDIAYYRVGSFAALEKMGYRHVTISFADRLFSIFVSARIYDQLTDKLLLSGFTKLSTQTINYSINPTLTRKFAPAVDEIMSEL